MPGYIQRARHGGRSAPGARSCPACAVGSHGFIDCDYAIETGTYFLAREGHPLPRGAAVRRDLKGQFLPVQGIQGISTTCFSKERRHTDIAWGNYNETYCCVG